MTKETQTQAIAEPFKFKNAALLNRLSEMAQVPYYATACHTLIQAEMAIVELERENATLRAEVERLAAQAAPSEAQADLVIAVHALASHFENTLYALRDDAEAVTKAKGDIAHALQISAKYNRNGAAAQPSQAPVVQAVQATQAVRMLTREELNDVALSDQVGWEPGEYIEAVQRKFCAVNAGRAIPPDGKIGGV